MMQLDYFNYFLTVFVKKTLWKSGKYVCLIQVHVFISYMGAV